MAEQYNTTAVVVTVGSTHTDEAIRRTTQGVHSHDDDLVLQVISESNDVHAASTSSKQPDVTDWILQYWINLKARWQIVFYGQLLSLLLTCGGAVLATLSLQCNLSSPAFTVGLSYTGLALCLIPLYRKQRHVPHRSIVSQVITEDDDDEEEKDEDDDESQMMQALEEEESSGLFAHPSAAAEPSYTFLSILSLQGPPWLYCIIATADVYASYFTVAAFKYTTITSVSLLSSIAVPSTMVISFVFLGRRFTWLHLVGMLLCVAGVSLYLIQDYEADSSLSSKLDQQNQLLPSNSDDNKYPHKVRGDLLAIVGGVIYGLNDVMVEFAIRKLGGPMEYLGMMGLFATMICIVQALVFERDTISSLWHSDECSPQKVFWLLAAFAGINFLGYVAGSKFMQISEATFYELSLQTGGLWAVLFSVMAQHIIPPLYFYVSLVVTVLGVCLYEMAPSPILNDRIKSKQDIHKRGRILHEGLLSHAMDRCQGHHQLDHKSSSDSLEGISLENINHNKLT